MTKTITSDEVFESGESCPIGIERRIADLNALYWDKVARAVVKASKPKLKVNSAIAHFNGDHR